MVKWSNPGKGVVPSLTPRCSSHWKESLQVALDKGRQLYFTRHSKQDLSPLRRYIEVIQQLKKSGSVVQWFSWWCDDSDRVYSPSGFANCFRFYGRLEWESLYLRQGYTPFAIKSACICRAWKDILRYSKLFPRTESRNLYINYSIRLLSSLQERSQ